MMAGGEGRNHLKCKLPVDAWCSVQHSLTWNVAKSCPLDNLFLCSEPESVNADPVFMALQERSCFSALPGLGSKIKEVPAAPHRQQIAAA